MSNQMPAIFFGHGNPMNALTQNAYTNAWKEIGGKISRPKAVLVISAHWYIPQTAVTAMSCPKTIHDFGGFPRKLFEFEYPAPGDVGLAYNVQKLLNPVPVIFDEEWGLDHGTWSVLCHVFPKADIPVVQLSINTMNAPREHYSIGKKLDTLRDEGILIIGSGNIVHNLSAYAWGKKSVDPYDWAKHFEQKVRDLIIAKNHEPLINYSSLGQNTMLSVPTPDHYLPLLYILALQREGEPVSFPIEGIDGGSISMLSVQVGTGLSRNK